MERLRVFWCLNIDASGRLVEEATVAVMLQGLEVNVLNYLGQSVQGRGNSCLWAANSSGIFQGWKTRPLRLAG